MQKSISATRTLLAALAVSEIHARAKRAGRIELRPSPKGGDFLDWQIGDQAETTKPEGTGIVGGEIQFANVGFVAGNRNSGTDPAVVLIGYVTYGDELAVEAPVQKFGAMVRAAVNENGPIYRNATTAGTHDAMKYAVVDGDGAFTDLAEALGWNEVNDVDVWGNTLVACGINTKGEHVYTERDFTTLKGEDETSEQPVIAVAIAQNGTACKVIANGKDDSITMIKLADDTEFTALVQAFSVHTARFRTNKATGATMFYGYDGKGGTVYYGEITDNLTETTLATVNKPAGLANATFHGVANTSGGQFLVFDGSIGDDVGPSPAWNLTAFASTQQTGAQAQ